MQSDLNSNLISILNCRIQDGSRPVLKDFSWQMNEGEAWLVTGPNGGGKADFVKALSSQLDFVPVDSYDPQKKGSFHSSFEGSVSVVSLEMAARLIEEERERDESEILDREDIGRTGRQYIAEVLGGSSAKNAPLPPIASRLETMPQVKLCGVEKILDRGLRYMSTGEIRRTLLCRALLSGSRLLILSDPFAGLDAESRRILLEFFDTMVNRQLNAKNSGSGFPSIILSMERFSEIPSSINKVLEFTAGKVSFCGERNDYEKILSERENQNREKHVQERNDFLNALREIQEKYSAGTDDSSLGKSSFEKSGTLIKFEDVNVGWGDHHVLVNLNWEVRHNEHYLIRGPNGSGKTTILELITGDNMQVFREKIYLFGKRRGSGETIWDIKKKLGIVSYRLHVEYRMVGDTSLLETIISGFYDSIGLYENPSDYEKAVARQWLKLAGFEKKEMQAFKNLSYGEQRAILILRAAVKSPRVLILDEPCHGLDENNRSMILDLLEVIAGTGTTTLLHVTHDPSEVLPCEKHVLELYPDQNPMYKIL
ncbi:MAG: ATP-binding cassette domain-containing protein [Treponema sp.]|nr:ATP-binding cassette domain-containing protein [Treponema sp.]